MAEYAYEPEYPGDAYEPFVQADGLVLFDGDLFDAPDLVAYFNLACDLGYDLASSFPVYLYLHGCYIPV